MDTGSSSDTPFPAPTGQAPLPSHNQARTALRQSVFAGQVTNWSPDKWTSEMKSAINELLVKVRGKRRMTRVEEQYRAIVQAHSDNPHSRLHMTNRHFIQTYERSMNRRMEATAVINYSEEQTQRVQNVTSELQQPGSVPSHIVSEDNAQHPARTPQVI